MYILHFNWLNFSDQFKKIIKRYIKVGYNLDVMRQSACLVLNPIMVYSGSFLFKGIYYCPIEIIKGLTDKGQFQYLTKLKGPQEGTYLYTTQFLLLR